MAPLNVEAAEQYLLAIPLLSLSDEPARVPTFKSLEHQVSVDSNVSNSSKRPSSANPWEWSVVAGVGLDIHKAEAFLTSLHLENGSAESLPDSFGSLLQAKEQPQGLQTSEQREEPPQNWHIIGESRNLDSHSQVLIRKGLVGGRLILSTRQSSTYVCSTRPLSIDNAGPGMLDTPQARAQYLAIRGSPWRGWTRRPEKWSRVAGTSYASYLEPSDPLAYDPNFLDDQSLRQGKHHTVLRLEAYQVSVIPFVRPRRLKEELNDQFRCSHPGIHPSITLSKLRNLQKDLREITLVIPELDMSTVALAWVYFEKLVLGDWVRKYNRKLLAGACLVLAFKFNQHGDRALVKQLAVCIRKLDRKDQLNVAALHDAELKVFVWLKFSLHVAYDVCIPHLDRMLKDLGTSPGEYYEGRCPEEDLDSAHFYLSSASVGLLADGSAPL